jgi:hypothetical protein
VKDCIFLPPVEEKSAESGAFFRFFAAFHVSRFFGKIEPLTRFSSKKEETPLRGLKNGEKERRRGVLHSSSLKKITRCPIFPKIYPPRVTFF